MTQLAPLHPGEVLREEFMGPLGITAYTLAKDAARLAHWNKCYGDLWRFKIAFDKEHKG
jgi:hypothetical protein